MAIDVTVHLTDEAETALQAVLQRLNAEIDARNRRIQAEKDLAAANGSDYVGPEPQELLTFEDVVQRRMDDAVTTDVRERARQIANDLATTYMSADPATQQAMMQDMAKYRRQPEPPPQPRGRRRQ